MLTIKKVQVVPLDENYGKIIDSFNTQDDKTKNAPSINAVENYVESYIDNKIAVVEAEIVIQSGETGNEVHVDFPTGFTKHNSVILSIMTSNIPEEGDSKIVWFPSYQNMVASIPSVLVYLGDLYNSSSNQITISKEFSTAVVKTTSVLVKVVLMRID